MKKNYPKRLDLKLNRRRHCVVRLVWKQKGQNSALSQLAKSEVERE